MPPKAKPKAKGRDQQGGSDVSDDDGAPARDQQGGELSDADHDMNLTLTDVVAERGQPIVREELAELKVDGADVAQVQLPADAPRAWELVKSRLEAIDHGARAFRKRIRKPEPEAGSAAARLQNGERPAPLVSAIVGEADADALYDDLGAVGDVG